MTTITLSRRVARATTLDRMLRATARALDDLVAARQRRRLDSVEVHAHRHATADLQRDRIGAVALQMMPR